MNKVNFKINKPQYLGVPILDKSIISIVLV